MGMCTLAFLLLTVPMLIGVLVVLVLLYKLGKIIEGSRKGGIILVSVVVGGRLYIWLVEQFLRCCK